MRPEKLALISIGVFVSLGPITGTPVGRE